MKNPAGPGSPRSGYITVLIVLAMLVLPAALTLHQVRISALVDVSSHNPSPYGYTVSLLLFIVPILALLLWLVPNDGVTISKKSFVRTIALLFPLGVMLDFFFAHLFLRFPNPAATLGIPAPALGHCENCHIFMGSPDHILVGSVPIEEYIFYFTGFIFVLLFYIWLDEYWLAAYSVRADARERLDFRRLLQFHPKSVLVGLLLIVVAILYRHYYNLHHPQEAFYLNLLMSLGIRTPRTLMIPPDEEVNVREHPKIRLRRQAMARGVPMAPASVECLSGLDTEVSRAFEEIRKCAGVSVVLLHPERIDRKVVRAVARVTP